MVVIAIGVMSCECQVRPAQQVIRVRHFAAKRVILIKDYEGT